MAYDEELADRAREILSGEPEVVEKRMFGGLGFMVAGNLALSVGSSGGLMLRVDPADRASLDEDPRVRPFEMSGRTMKNWRYVHVDASVDDAELQRWIRYGVSYAHSLPPK